MNEEVMAIENVSKTYEMGTEKLTVLNNVSLNIGKGDFISILGPSGSGKSTLLHLIGLLDKPSKGEVRLNGVETSKLPEKEQAKLRNRTIGFVFQNFNLIPSLTVLENVALPAVIGEGDKEEAEKKARRILGQVGLGERLFHYPNQLSGGQKQRVAVARALVNDPDIILADEPTGNLDTKSGAEVLRIFRELNEGGKTIIIITHDRSIAHATKKTVEIVDGKIVGVKK